ncbi:hypothetical protein SAPIO_CDS6619 [Scedosporium apiospermum]|uniref:Uncharacterized protein n=1 Tax=Pseudallescheria apiosperma TaxID=563466 RepID=A0A084G3K6_PSEDA|nr:uncharacterized protein SAPIO_CDS6619 [Scedosporium apiospermum]KEZ41918.1 hypothetical protein SAPIO_CDS6619 [Scedosporium apiospermum]
MHAISLTYLTFFLPVPIAVFYALSLAGCTSTSPALPSIYLASVDTSSGLTVRIGYFGACVLLNSTLSCVTTPYGTSPADAGTALGLPASQPLAQGEETRQQDSPLQIAFDLQRKIFLSLIAEAAALFGFSLLLLLLSLYVAKKSGAATENTFGSRFLHRSPTIFLNISTGLALVVAVSITQTGNALEYQEFKFTQMHLRVSQFQLSRFQ